MNNIILISRLLLLIRYIHYVFVAIYLLLLLELLLNL